MCESVFFFFNDTATTEIYTLSLHDALPISSTQLPPAAFVDFMQNHDQIGNRALGERLISLTQEKKLKALAAILLRSEEHTSELQSPCNLVCRLLLEKKKNEVINSDLQRART